MINIRIAIDGNCHFCRFSSILLKSMVKIPLEIQFQGSDKYIEWEKQFPSELWAIDSLKVIAKDHVLIKSAGINYLMQYAKWYYQPFRIFFLLPQSFLDVIYDLIARNRYLWGTTCRID